MNNLVSVEYSPIRRHRRDPQEAEIDDHPCFGPGRHGVVGGPITSPSPSVERFRTRCLILLCSLIEREYPPAALIDELDRDQDQALFGLPPRYLAGADRSALTTAASLKGGRLETRSQAAPGVSSTQGGIPRPCPRPRSGDSWDAIISEFVERSAGRLLVRTRQLDFRAFC